MSNIRFSLFSAPLDQSLVWGLGMIQRLLLLVFIAVLSGCSMLPSSSSSDFSPPIAYSVYEWQVIDSGRVGNAVTGIENVKLVRPVAVAARGNKVYIADAGQQRLFVYDQGAATLKVLIDLKGVLRGEVTDLFVGTDHSIYIADGEGARVLHFDYQGRLLNEFGDAIALGRPVEVHVDEARGWVFIADGFNDDVLIYNNSNGQLINSIGKRGDGEGGFRTLTAFAQGPEGYYVGTRLGAHRVQMMDMAGEFSHNLQQDTVTFPTAIVVDVDDRVFVSDYLDNTIKVYVGGRHVDTLGGNGSAPGKFRRITDMWLDDGLLYVADSLNGRIQVLRVVIGMTPDFPDVR